MKTLYFNLEQPHDYFVIDHLKEGSILLEQGNCDELDDIVDKIKSSEKNIAIIPGELVNVLDVDIPIKSRKKALQAIPFALEDHLAGNIEELHFELLDWQPGETSTVAVINLERWNGYLYWVKEHAVELHRIIADFDLLPIQEEESAFLFEDFTNEKVLIKFRQGSLVKGVTIASDELVYWAEEFDASDKNIVTNNSLALSNLIPQDLMSSVSIAELNTNSIVDLCLRSNGIPDDLALFSSNQSKQAREKSRPWIIGAFCFLLLAGLINIGTDIYEFMVLKKKQQVLDERIEEIFKQSFPRVERIVDARLQFQREVDAIKGNAQGTQEFLFLLEKLLNSFSKNAGNIIEIFYRNSGLDVVFQVRNFQRLDQFEKRFASGSDSVAQANRLSSDSQGGIVTAKYRLTLAGQSDE